MTTQPNQIPATVETMQDDANKTNKNHASVGITPGPWSARHVPMRGISDDTWCIDWSDDQEEVAEIVHGEANARLIASAPETAAERDRLKEINAELLEALKKMYRAYVNLLENGHDRISSLGGDCDPVDCMEQVDFNLIECRAAIAKATNQQ